MAECKLCGKPLGKGRLFSSVCKECAPRWEEMRAAEDAAKTEAADAEATERLSLLVERLAGGEPCRAFALGYWDTRGTAASSVFDKAVGAALLGGMGSAMTSKTHRLGLLVLTKNKLRVCDLCSIVGESVDSTDILDIQHLGELKATSYDLEDVTLEEVHDGKTRCTLFLRCFPFLGSEPKPLTAVFPDCFLADNPARAFRIAGAFDPNLLDDADEDDITYECAQCGHMQVEGDTCDKCGGDEWEIVFLD